MGQPVGDRLLVGGRPASDVRGGGPRVLTTQDGQRIAAQRSMAELGGHVT
jgi:hypothetical protein